MSSSTLIPPTPEGASRKRNVLDVLKVAQPNSKILVRVDFNVPMDHKSDPALPVITDDSRIRGALPTIQAIRKEGHSVILCSHMGRPKLVQKGGDDEETNLQKKQLSLKPVASHLAELLGEDVAFAPDCLDAETQVNELDNGILLLENLRFYKMEEQNDTKMATTLASYCDAYINDAFGTCHRAHASTAGVPNTFSDKTKCGIGALVASELAFLDFTKADPSDKISAIIGGSKVSTKLPVITGLLKSNVDVLVLGGGLAYTFLKAQGVKVGSSLVEDSMIDTAKGLLQQAKDAGKTIVLPVDTVCSASFPSGPMELSDTTTVTNDEGVPDGWMGLDVGPKTVDNFKEALAGSSKLVFNGPMGVFENKPFDLGTRGLVDGIVDLTKNHGCTSVVGGGDSVAALELFGLSDAVSYVSTGGGATLELLAGDKLPGVEAIDTM